MTPNWLGPILAASAFVSIWVGHLGVRKIEAASHVLWLPMLMTGLGGLALEALLNVRPPGKEREQAQAETDLIPSIQVGACDQLLRGLPQVARATAAPGPGWGIARRGQAQG